MNRLLQLIGDGEQPSTMRVLVLVIVVPIMLVWAVLCLRQNTFIVPDWKVVSLIITGVAGKWLQSTSEAQQDAIAARRAATLEPITRLSESLAQTQIPESK